MTELSTTKRSALLKLNTTDGCWLSVVAAAADDTNSRPTVDSIAAMEKLRRWLGMVVMLFAAWTMYRCSAVEIVDPGVSGTFYVYGGQQQQLQVSAQDSLLLTADHRRYG